MNRIASLPVLAIAMLSIPAASQAQFATTIAINPSSDGSIYVCDGCNPVPNGGGYLLVSGYIHGALRFPTSMIDGPVTGALLTVNPYGLPLHGRTLDVYGFPSDSAVIDRSDAFATNFLGTWILPEGLGYGQDAAFDVSDFMRSVATPYVGFNLRSSGTDVFSSLEYNYGHPAQLRVTYIPEPGGTSLAAIVGLSALAALRSRLPRRVQARSGQSSLAGATDGQENSLGDGRQSRHRA
jgi:hypothetical protein